MCDFALLIRDARGHWQVAGEGDNKYELIECGLKHVDANPRTAFRVDSPSLGIVAYGVRL